MCVFSSKTFSVDFNCFYIGLILIIFSIFSTAMLISINLGYNNNEQRQVMGRRHCSYTN